MTAADGAEEAYSRDGNKARTETPAQALASDVAMRAAWSRHPLVRVVRHFPLIDTIDTLI